jgi:putative phage-type endonuclease
MTVTLNCTNLLNGFSKRPGGRDDRVEEDMSVDRRRGIGGTDIAALAGLNPWKTPMDVYLEKLGLVEEQPDNENMWWGREMEPILRKRYEQETGHTLYSPGLVRHPDISWYAGTPDDLVNWRGIADMPGCWISSGGVDYKTTGYSKIDDWGEPETDEVPDWIHCQADWYMGLTGAMWWDVAVLFMGARREFRIYRILRNQEVIDRLIEIGRDFWEDHILTETPPPIDGSDASSRYLKITYLQERGPLIETDGEIDIWAGHLAKAKEQFKMLGHELSEIENWLKNRIGHYIGIRGTWGKLTWKKNKDSTVVDYKAAYDELSQFVWSNWGEELPQNEPSEILKRHTIIKPGARVFRPYFKGEKE